jgi:TatD-related deoxyribonuclease
MTSSSNHPFSILDNHVHLDFNGLNIEAAKRFQKAGGTHLIVSHKPYRECPINTGKDYINAFDRTLELVDLVNKNSYVKAYATLGPYPVDFLSLNEKRGLEHAKETLLKGMDIAQEYVLEGKAIGIGEIGRPHFSVPEDVLEASNQIMVRGMELAKEANCPVILHTESAKEEGHIPGILNLAKGTGIDPGMIIKHFSPPKLADPKENQGVIPSIVARRKSILKACRLSKDFLMETDYIDSLERPDAVLPPETVPEITLELLEGQTFTEEDVFHIHKDLPQRLYGIDIE